MNKTIIININGIVFHIEEDAYEILKNYMTDVKRHFSNSADSLEITTDIENRIAEMFSELLLKENKQVIVEQDVKLIIEQMGTVADFESAENDSKADQTTYTYNNREGRRLFRDPDDHLLAGVCAGIANYFDMNPVWIRLIFAVFVLVGGSGILLYCILWIIVPKAVTRADRMAMKGEKQNLQGFKKNFEDELSSVKQNLSNFGREATPFVYKARDFAGDFFYHLGVFFNGAGKVLVKMIGIFLLLVCFGFAIFLIVLLIGIVGFDAMTFHHVFPLSVFESRYMDAIVVSAFVVAFIPVLSIILLIIKALFNTRSINRSAGSTILVIWLVALGFLVYYSAKTAANFREGASFMQTINIKPLAGNTYYLKINDLKYFTAEDSARLNIKTLFNKNMSVIDNDDDMDRELDNVNLSIERSDVNQPVLVESFSARGRSYDDALFNARNTKYIFTQQDSVITFDPKLRRNREDNWHGEEVYLTLRLPLNAKVIVDEDMRRICGVNVYDCNVSDKKENARAATFIMTDNGLQCKIDTLVTAKKDSVKKDSLQ
jgi:phage shock protein PspC (stress-responsive transcriptional regulator)